MRTSINIFVLGACLCAGQTIQPYKAKDIEVYRGDSQARPAPPPPSDRSAGPVRPLDASGNLVEPLSNGLTLTMRHEDIVAKFGDPERSWDSRTMSYPGFGVQVGGAHEEIWHLTLKRGIRLNCGIGPGSTREDVIRVFGRPSVVTYDQYKLTFNYDSDRVYEIKIDPADGEFHAFRRDVNGSVQGRSGSLNAPDGRSSNWRVMANLAGTWNGIGSTMGRIDIKPDGTYLWAGQVPGRYTIQGDTIVFTGPLEAFAQGRAKISDKGYLEFYGKNRDGFQQYFVFSK